MQRGGRRIRRSHLLALFLPGDASSTRVGITVSRKVGNAVIRNRVKRCLREAIRHEHLGIDGNWDVVLIAHPNAKDASPSRLRREVREVFTRLENLGGSR